MYTVHIGLFISLCLMSAVHVMSFKFHFRRNETGQIQLVILVICREKLIIIYVRIWKKKLKKLTDEDEKYFPTLLDMLESKIFGYKSLNFLFPSISK